MVYKQITTQLVGGMFLSKKQAFQNADWLNQRFRNYLGSYTRKLNSLSHFLHKQKAIRNIDSNKLRFCH